MIGKLLSDLPGDPLGELLGKLLGNLLGKVLGELQIGACGSIVDSKFTNALMDSNSHSQY